MTVKRRDFLAGATLAPLAMPLLARAAFAQGARSGAPSDSAIASLAIYPALGVSRVGNSTKWFLAPEVPGVPALPDGAYKDGTERVKKQVQRFRIYAFNRAGEVIREIAAPEARIEWTVHVANTKAAWYGFNNPLDNGELAPGLSSQKRNQSFVDDKTRAEMLVIDPGAKTILGLNVNSGGSEAAYAMVGRFWNSIPVKLGHLQTDAVGRLLVFPGDGHSQSAVPNNPISNFSDNDGWLDDWCDGVVAARVRFTGTDMAADNAWVTCCGPHFAPEIPPFVSLYDLMSEVNEAAGWTVPPKPPLSFRKYIYPLFHRMALMNWVAAAADLQRGWTDVPNFGDPAVIARLADPSPGNKPFRERIFAAFRNPNVDDQQQFKLPYMLGDGINYQGSPVRWYRIAKRQYAILRTWADGNFSPDLGDPNAPSDVVALERLPLAEQPEALNRAALEMCSGGAFHPGVEMTWPLRHKELYRGPFRIALSTTRARNLVQDLGQLLTPDKAFHGFGATPPAIAPQMPGDVTRWMGIPWQCDAFSCQQVVFSNDFPNATWWPALLPIDVLPQRFYDAAMNPSLSAAERVKFYASRVAWSRGVAGIGYHAEASYNDGLNQMIYLWNRMGFVVRRPGPTDANRPREIPPVLYVEVDRGTMSVESSELFRGQRPFNRPPG